MKTKFLPPKWALLLVLPFLYSCKDDEDPAPPIPETFTLEAVAAATPTEVEVGETVQLTGSSSKDEGEIGYEALWTVASKPENSNATISNATSVTTSFVPDIAGTYELQLTIENEERNVSSSDKVTVTATNPASIVISDNITQDLVLDNINPDPEEPDYLVTNMIEVGARLSIEPGVNIFFEENTGFNIGEQGTLIANGTEDEKIIFTGTSQEPGFWAGIKSRSKAVNNSISNAEINYAGSLKQGTFFEKAALSLEFTTMNLENVVISHSGQYGIQTREGETIIPMTNLSFENNGGSHLYIHPEQIQYIDENSNFNGGYVELFGGDIASQGNDVSWANLNNGKYLISKDLAIARTVTIAPGAVFEAADGVLITVAEHENAAIIAKGTLENPIEFSSITKQAGAWKGILIRSHNDKSLMEFVAIENGGSAAMLGTVLGPANLGLAHSGKLTLRNAHIANSAGHGIALIPNSNATLTSSDITYENNALGDMKAD